jgi:hypothetical protein
MMPCAFIALSRSSVGWSPNTAHGAQLVHRIAILVREFRLQAGGVRLRLSHDVRDSLARAKLVVVKIYADIVRQ